MILGMLLASSVALARPDALMPPSLGEVKVVGHVAEVQSRFFENRIFSEFARNEIWKEARDAFAKPDDDVFRKPVGMWKGEFWGKLMISACRVAEYSGNAALKEFLHSESLRLIAYQHADGYLGTYVNPEFVQPGSIEEAKKAIGWPCDWNWNLWCRKYTLWGLMACYRLTGDRKLLDAASRAMDQQIAMLRRLGLRLCDTGTTAMRGLPPCSILKPLLWLYEDTGKREYLDYAKEVYGYFNDPSCRAPQFAALLKSGKPIQDWYPAENGHWGKAYEMMSCLAGFVEYYRVTGDKAALEVAKAMQSRIAADELNLCLSVGYNDQFWGAARALNGVSEPCDAVHWMRLNHDLWLVTGEAKYVDAMELTFYNAFLAAIRPDGKWGARCVRSHGRHMSAPPQSGMKLQHCCVNNMPRGFMDVAQSLVAKNSVGDILVAMYHDATVSVGGDRVEISGNYPISEEVKVVVTRKRAGKLRFRVPEWCGQLIICGGGLCVPAMDPGWAEVEAPLGRSEWELKFDMNPRVVDSNRAEVPGYENGDQLVRRWCDGSEKDLRKVLNTKPKAQLMYGPLLLARSVKVGSSADELFGDDSINKGGWKLKLEPVANPGVWGAWKATLKRKGFEVRSFPVCDYSSSGGWEDGKLEFNTLF